MHIGLYFGSFNPIHIGHLIIASFVANNTDVQKVWFVVSPQNPLKPSSTLLNEYQRLHLVKLAVENDPQLQVSDIEFKLPRPSYTIDTLIYLQEKYPQHTFSTVIGSDSYQNLPNWKNGALLLEKYSFLVYERPAYKVINTGKNINVLHAPLLDISSTMIRKLIANQQSIQYLVSQPVLEEIQRSGYYQK